jgi:DNA modification methylase
MGIPWRVAFALQDDGWLLRSDIIWHKPNVMPSSVKDRPTTAHEYVFLFTKKPRYWYDAKAIQERANTAGDTRHARADNTHIHKVGATPIRSRETTGNPTGEYRNARTVWQISTRPYKGAHFATFPEELARRCIVAGCPEGGTVLDPFFGSGTTGKVAKDNGRYFAGIELNPEYVKLSTHRISANDVHVFGVGE